MTVDRKEYPYEMKSRASGDDERVYYSELQVCNSGAGYYIGRMGWVEDKKLGGYQEPYSRESEYYPTREVAEKALKSGMFDRHSGVENEFAKQEGNMPTRKITPEMKEQGILFCKAVYRHCKLMGPIKTHESFDDLITIIVGNPDWSEEEFLKFMEADELLEE